MKWKLREFMMDARTGIVCSLTRAAAVLLVALVAAVAQAQVPQEVTFRGRLVDGAGTPETGPVNLELRVFDAETVGTEIYAESHTAVPLDANGAFAVQLGAGSPLAGTFDAVLFSDVNRWLEVVVNANPLSPRQIIGSVPWALIAQQANEIVPDPNAPRFEDCGDGTLADHQTGLQWEKKTGVLATSVDCEAVSCPDPRNVNNRYAWSTVGFVDPGPTRDGGVFRDFLLRLNGEFDPAAATGCFANHCDWRIPKVSELQTITIGPGSAPGQAAACSASPCVDPAFVAIAGPFSSFQWTDTTDVTLQLFPLAAVVVPSPFRYIFLLSQPATDVLAVRGVRTGSCR